MTDIVEWCNSEFVIDTCKFHCTRIKGHEGNHMREEYSRRYVVIWYDNELSIDE